MQFIIPVINGPAKGKSYNWRNHEIVINGLVYETVYHEGFMKLPKHYKLKEGQLSGVKDV